MRFAAGSLVLRIASLLLVGLLGSSCIAHAQAQAGPDKPKAKRVWTNEDVENIKGGINVVGEPAQPAPSSKTKDEKPATPEVPAELCESDGWARAVAYVIQARGARMGARFWATHLFNNLCTGSVQVDAVGRRITGDYTLEDGAKIHLKAEVLPHNLPKAAELVAAVNEQRPFIVAWKGHPYIIDRVDYVDNVYDGISMYSISKLYMTNALTGRTTLWEATSANVKEIDATLQIAVTTRQ